MKVRHAEFYCLSLAKLLLACHGNWETADSQRLWERP